MTFKRPKIIGTMKIHRMKASNLAVMNDIKNPPNKIIVPCRNQEHGQEIIKKIKDAQCGDTLHF